MKVHLLTPQLSNQDGYHRTVPGTAWEVYPRAPAMSAPEFRRPRETLTRRPEAAPQTRSQSTNEERWPVLRKAEAARIARSASIALWRWNSVGAPL